MGSAFTRSKRWLPILVLHASACLPHVDEQHVENVRPSLTERPVKTISRREADPTVKTEIAGNLVNVTVEQSTECQTSLRSPMEEEIRITGSAVPFTLKFGVWALCSLRNRPVLNAGYALRFLFAPTIAGVNWYEGFDTPIGAKAELQIAGAVRGGHEVELLAIDVDAKLVRGCNSWGSYWGDHGYFTISFATLERLLGEQGDVVIPLP